MSLIWLLGSTGVLIILLGAYVAGGGEVTCARVGGPAAQAEAAEPASQRPPVIATCQVRTTRWLGRHVVADQTYARVTGVDWKSGRKGGTLQLTANGAVIAPIGATNAQGSRAYGQLREWFEGDARRPMVLEFSEWPFAYAAFGFATLWLATLGPALRQRVRRREAPRPRTRTMGDAPF